MTWVGLGSADDAFLTITAPAGNANRLKGSIFVRPDGPRRPVVATWDGAASTWRFQINDPVNPTTAGILSLSGTTLQMIFTNAFGTYTAPLTDARNLWTGNWRGTQACVSGYSRSINWTIKKGTGRTDLQWFETSNQTTPIGTVQLVENQAVGRLTDGSSRTYQCTADFIGPIATGGIRFGSTNVATMDACTMGLNR